VLLEVLGHALALVDELLELGMGDVARHHQGAGEQQRRRDRVLAELGQDLLHGPIEVDLHPVLVLPGPVGRGDEAPRVVIEVLDPDPLPVDASLDVAVGRAGDAHAHGAGGAVAREPDHADVVGEVLAAELGPDAQLVGCLEELRLQLQVAEGDALRAAGGGQAVVVAGRGELHRLEVGLRRGAADDGRDVVRRAGGRAQVLHLVDQELLQLARLEERLGLLPEHGLVGRASALGHEEELVGRPLGGVDVDLCRKVVAGVLLLVEVQGAGLRVAQVLPGVGLPDPLGEVLLVLDAGPDLLPLLGHHGGGARVLADGELAARRDLGVAQEGEGHALVVLRGVGIGEDLRHLLVVRGPQEEVALAQRLARQPGKGRGLHLQHLLPVEGCDRDALLGEKAVARVVLREGERVVVLERGRSHGFLLVDSRAPSAERAWPSGWGDPGGCS
jgi:hypothetical protein